MCELKTNGVDVALSLVDQRHLYHSWFEFLITKIVITLTRAAMAPDMPREPLWKWKMEGSRPMSLAIDQMQDP